jgi:hypothetical protein
MTGELRPGELECRQGDAQAHRRAGPRDPDRRALRLLGLTHVEPMVPEKMRWNPAAHLLRLIFLRDLLRRCLRKDCQHETARIGDLERAALPLRVVRL